MFLVDSRIRLRALEPEDLDLLYRWENDTVLWRYGNTISPYSKLALRQYINDSLEMDIYQSKQLRLMIDLVGTKETIGTIDLYDLDVRNSRAGVGVLIDENFRNRDYAYSALMLIKDYAFRFLKLNQLYAYIGITNEASLYLFQKAGYQSVGVLKQWTLLHDDNGRYENVCITQLVK